jgi:hypothetical protein
MAELSGCMGIGIPYSMHLALVIWLVGWLVGSGSVLVLVLGSAVI